MQTQQKFNLRTELAFFSHTHRTDKIQRPDLYRQNNISYDEKLENMCILLSDDAITNTANVAYLPTNEDGIKALHNSAESTDNLKHENMIVNTFCSVMWIEKTDKAQWNLGYILDINEEDNTFEVDHLHRHPEGQNKFWKYPKTRTNVH